MSHREKAKAYTRWKAVYITIILVAVALLSILSLMAIHRNSTTVNIPYLNVSDVNGAIPDASYTLFRYSQITNFSPVLKDEGYLAAAVSVFNLTSTTMPNVTPNVITSVLFLMSNPQAANSTLESLLFSNNANQSIRGFVYNGTVVSNQTYKKVEVHFYTVSSVAVYNTSVINYTVSSGKSLSMPDFQSTTLFSYGDYVGTVVTNSYVYSRALQNDSIKLAELLVGKLAASH